MRGVVHHRVCIVSGTLSGSYASDTNGGNGDLWNLNGSLTGMVNGDWGLEAPAAITACPPAAAAISTSGNIGGSVFWAGMQGRLAATVNYYSTSTSGIDFNVTNYGLGGEWYVGPQFTVAFKGGADTVNASGFGGSGSETGGYAGGMLQWYAMPNLALSGAVDYTEIAGVHATSETAKVEWLFSAEHAGIDLRRL